MIIDIHTHIFPDQIAARTLELLGGKSHTPPFSDGTAAGLAASARAAGIDYAIILPVATAARQVPHINQNAFAQREDNLARGLLSLAAMHPDCDDWEAQLDYIASHGFRGIKIHPVYQGVDLDDPRYIRILRCAASLDLVVVTHTGLDIGYPGMIHCSPEMAARVLDAVPDVKLVLAHMGGWKEWDRAARLLSGSGVWLDTSFSTGEIIPKDDGYFAPDELPLLSQDAFLEMTEAFGADHILFGTDSPWRDQADAIAWIRALPLPDADINLILGENARKLLSL